MLQDGVIINDIKDNSNAVRKWYNDNCKQIHSLIDQSAPLEKRAKEAFLLRNEYRVKARAMMNNRERAKELMDNYPMKSFEEIYEHKTKVKGLSHEQALEDIIKTAEKTNDKFNKEAGL